MMSPDLLPAYADCTAELGSYDGGGFQMCSDVATVEEVVCRFEVVGRFAVVDPPFELADEILALTSLSCIDVGLGTMGENGA